MKIQLDILAEDIKETQYANAKDCAITRALNRAGYPNLRDGGIIIKDMETGNTVIGYTNPDYAGLAGKVSYMYMGWLPTIDFSVTLDLNI